MNGPDVSVVIPTRDRPEQLRTAVRSALAQRVDLDLVVVDDASAESASSLLADLDDDRIRVLRNNDPLGETASRNRGISEAAGSWIAFLDDDDLWAPNKITHQLEASRRQDRVWAYAGDVMVNEDLRIVAGAPPPDPDELVRTLPRYNSVPSGASNVLVRSSVLASVGPFDPDLQRTGDWDMWLRLLAVGPPACAPEPLVANRVHPGNVSRDMSRLFLELPLIASRHGIDVDVARHHRWAAWTARLDGRRVDAARAYLRAARLGDFPSIGRAAVALAMAPPGATATSDIEEAEWARQAREWLRSFARTSG